MFNSNTPFTMPVAPTSGNNGMFGNDGGWWIIILFALIFGWGNGGSGFWGGNGSAGAASNYVLTSDFANLSRQMDNGFDGIRQQNTAIANGISSLGYDQLAQMNGINQNISNTGYAIQNAIQSDTIANMQNVNNLSSQLASCCCENRQAIAGVNYNLATQNCATNTQIANSTRDVIDTNNANTRAILDALNAQAIAAKDDKIACLTAQVNNLSLAASQQAQNNYLVSQIRPSPVPAYTVANPYNYYTGTTFA